MSDTTQTTRPLRRPAPGMLRITNTELVWPEKYSEDGTRKEIPRISLPFQVIERINESRATQEAKKAAQPSLFDIWEGKEGETFEEGWHNKLIWGENLLVMGSLLEKFAGKVDLIYIDPPFATGADFSFTTPIGDGKLELTKEQSIIEEKAYRDTWGGGDESWLGMIWARLPLMHDLLSDTGNFFLHIDYRLQHYAKILLDEVFGRDALRNQIVWYYNSGAREQFAFGKRHHLLFRYSKSGASIPFFDDRGKGRRESVRVPYSPDINIPASKAHYYDPEGKVRDDVWEIPIPGQNDKTERTGFETQKPERLLDLIVASSSPLGGLVADLFSGSGTTLAAAEKLGRRWIGCDLSRWAIQVTRKRLLDIPGCKPFEVLNLGVYERQYWQGVTFGDGEKTVSEQTLYEYLAFILKLYGAQPVAGLQHLHGKKGRSLVHIGAADAPVTIDEINLALDECAKLKRPELHVLGWEWEMGLAGPNNDYRKGGLMHEVAKQKGIKLVLLQIPREVMEEQATAKGDVRFFELAYLDVEIKKPKKLTVIVRFKDFVIPNTELIPEGIREKVRKWSDYVDYWAVDWDFQNDTFMQGWVTYRTRQDRSLALASEQHTYDKPGRYRILVKVVDIFGNDTSQAHDVEVA